MKLSIPAWEEDRYLSLTELLILFGRYFIKLKWYVRVEEAAPEPGAEKLESLDPLAPIDIFELLHLVSPTIQIIDGTITAKETEDAEPKLVLRAVDSSSWDIETNNIEVLSLARSRFPELFEFD